MLNDPRVDIIVRQFETLWVLFSRPVVQRQIVAVGLILILAWLLARVISTWVHPWLARIMNQRLAHRRDGRLFRLLSIIKWLYFPLIGLALIPLVVLLFEYWQFTAGLIANSAIIFWILLVYEVILGLLDLWFSRTRIHTLRTRILDPLFILLPTAVFLNQFIDVRSILSIELFTVLGARITLGRIGLAALWLYVFYILGWIVVEALRNVILPRTQANSGVANSITTITRYVIVIAGFLVVFATLGVDLTSLALIGTGLTVGIGFGMQQVIANFISGILLLFEQSLRPGDLIEIDNRVGTVQQLNIRSTIIRTVDAEIIVPNETFLTSQLTTFTKSNMLGRVVVPIGVSYQDDPQRVRQILIDTAVQHDLVLEDPPPVVFFDGFGESSLNFLLVSWVTQPHERFQVRSDLHFMIWDALRAQDIEIPFPQRDLNLRDGWEQFSQALADRPARQTTDGDGRLPIENAETG